MFSSLSVRVSSLRGYSENQKTISMFEFRQTSVNEGILDSRIPYGNRSGLPICHGESTCTILHQLDHPGLEDIYVTGMAFQSVWVAVFSCRSVDQIILNSRILHGK